MKHFNFSAGLIMFLLCYSTGNLSAVLEEKVWQNRIMEALNQKQSSVDTLVNLLRDEQRGADANAYTLDFIWQEKMPDGTTTDTSPLIKAINKGAHTFIEKLLEKGASATFKAGGNDPLNTALADYSQAKSHIMREGVIREGHTLQNDGRLKNYLRIIELLINKGADAALLGRYAQEMGLQQFYSCTVQNENRAPGSKSVECIK